MNTKSKYTLRFCAIIGMILFLEILLCALLLFLLSNNHYQLSLILIVSIFLVGWWMQKYFKVVPPVTITNTEIIIGYWVWSKRIPIDEICEFQLTDSFPISKWISGDRVTNGFSIRTKADEEYVFYERFYKNPHELRARFAQITNMNFVPRDSAIDNPFTSLTSPLSFKIEIILFWVSLVLAILFFFLAKSPGYEYLFFLSFLFILFAFVIVGSIYEDKRNFITIVEVEGKEIRFKYNFPSSRVITVNINDIITCNFIVLNDLDIGFVYITPDFRRVVIKGSNPVWTELLVILEKNGVPVTDVPWMMVLNILNN